MLFGSSNDVEGYSTPQQPSSIHSPICDFCARLWLFRSGLTKAASIMQTMAERVYSDEQAQEILRMAARSSLGSGAVSRIHLLETAAELGISPEEVAHAENEFFERQELESDRKAFRQQKRKWFFREASQWVSGAVLLYGIALVTSGFQFRGLLDEWPKWPVGFWGLFLIKDMIEYYVDLTVNQEAAFEKWRRKKLKEKKGATIKLETEMESPTASPISEPQEPTVRISNSSL